MSAISSAPQMLSMTRLAASTLRWSKRSAMSPAGKVSRNIGANCDSPTRPSAMALVHAQTETLSSFDQAQQRILLDRFAGISTDAIGEAYSQWRDASQKLDDLLQGEQDRLRMLDLWTYQRKEIESAQLQPGEDEALETEKRVLANAEKLYSAAMSAFDKLYEGSDSAEAALRAALRNIEELARYDARFNEAVQQIQSARAAVGDVGASVRDYAEGINASRSAWRRSKIAWRSSIA